MVQVATLCKINIPTVVSQLTVGVLNTVLCLESRHCFF